MQYTFFVHSLPLFAPLQRETSGNVLVTRFMEEMSCSSSLLLFTAAHFHLALVATSISHFVTAATKFSCCSSNKKMTPLFVISRSGPLRFAGLPPTFSFSLSFSSSIFQICGNKKKKVVHYVLMDKKRIIREMPGIKKQLTVKKFRPPPPYIYFN